MPARSVASSPWACFPAPKPRRWEIPSSVSWARLPACLDGEARPCSADGACATTPSTTRRRFRSARPRRRSSTRSSYFRHSVHGLSRQRLPVSGDGRRRAGRVGGHDVVPLLLQVHQLASRRGEVHGAQHQLFGMGGPLRARAAGHDADAASIVCCVVILAGTILAASDWNELFSRGSRQVDEA